MSERNDFSARNADPDPEQNTGTEEAQENVEQEQNMEVEGPQEEEPQEKVSFFSRKNLRVAQVNIFCGLLNGYNTGFVAVYSTLYGLSTNCALYKSEKSCTTLSNAKCEWFTTAEGNYCNWPDVQCVNAYSEIPACSADKRCQWSYSSSACENKSGFTSAQSGIFAGAMILGCFIGSFFGGPISRLIGPRLVFLIVGIVAVVCSVLFHISTAVNQFWVLCVFRLIIGIVLGGVCVAAPMFVAENAIPRYSKMIGVLFQVCTTLGIFLAATMGLALGQSVRYKSDSNQHLMPRMQGLCVLSTVFSLLVVLLGIFLDDGRRKKKHQNKDGDAAEETEEIEEQPKEKQYGWGRMVPQLLIAIVVAGTLQLTGINAVMNYAPTIMGSLGTAPLVGNFVVMVWNFVTTICSIPLASVFTMRQLFLFGSIVTSLMCLFMCGVPVYPGVTKKPQAKNGVAIAGILVFIAAFECCVGPCFYVLAQDLFPKSFRDKGASFTNVVQFIFNVVINVCYPIATERISGGPSGNQDKGQAIAFIFFGGLGIICFIVQIFFLRPWDEQEQEAADKAADAAAAANAGNGDGENPEQNEPTDTSSHKDSDSKDKSEHVDPKDIKVAHSKE